MKRIVSIGIVAAAGSLFAWAVPAFAQQDDQPVKRHRPAAQTAPGQPFSSSVGNGPVSPSQRGPMVSPRFGSQPQQLGAARAGATSRSAAPTFERVPSRGLPAQPSRQIHRVPRAQTSSPRKSASKNSVTKKKETEKESGPKSGESAARGDNTKGEHQAASAQAEHAPATPARTPPPVQAPPTAASQAPPMMVPNAPPVVSAPAEHVAQPPVAQAQPRAQHAPPLSGLSDDERARLQSAHLNALHDPNLAASRARYIDARKEFRQKLRAALLKADPSVQPILEKIHRDKPEDH